MCLLSSIVGWGLYSSERTHHNFSQKDGEGERSREAAACSGGHHNSVPPSRGTQHSWQRGRREVPIGHFWTSETFRGSKEENLGRQQSGCVWEENKKAGIWSMTF